MVNIRMCGSCSLLCVYTALYGPQQRVSYVGIADGVGSWAEVMMDSKLYM